MEIKKQMDTIAHNTIYENPSIDLFNIPGDSYSLAYVVCENTLQNQTTTTTEVKYIFFGGISRKKKEENSFFSLKTVY